MKFVLQMVDQVNDGNNNRPEDRYHYLSEDREFHCKFYADKEPWTWVINTNLTTRQAEDLIEKFCEQGVSDSPVSFESRIKQLEIDN